jgi:hypothetical protein
MLASYVLAGRYLGLGARAAKRLARPAAELARLRV